jgi:hypothetical protein
MYNETTTRFFTTLIYLSLHELPDVRGLSFEDYYGAVKELQDPSVVGKFFSKDQIAKGTLVWAEPDLKPMPKSWAEFLQLTYLRN